MTKAFFCVIFFGPNLDADRFYLGLLEGSSDVHHRRVRPTRSIDGLRHYRHGPGRTLRRHADQGAHRPDRDGSDRQGQGLEISGRGQPCRGVRHGVLVGLRPLNRCRGLRHLDLPRLSTPKSPAAELEDSSA